MARQQIEHAEHEVRHEQQNLLKMLQTSYTVRCRCEQLAPISSTAVECMQGAGDQLDGKILAVSTVGAVWINAVEDKNQPSGKVVAMADAGESMPGEEVQSSTIKRQGKRKKKEKQKTSGKYLWAGTLVWLRSPHAQLENKLSFKY